MNNIIPVDFKSDINRRAIEALFTHFLVIGPGYFGKGKTLREAKMNCIKEGCKAKEKMVAFWGTKDIGINDSGWVSAKNMVEIGDI